MKKIEEGDWRKLFINNFFYMFLEHVSGLFFKQFSAIFSVYFS